MTHKKPKKRKRYFVVTAQDGGHWIEVNNIDIGYNQACEDWEKWFRGRMKDIPSKYTELINKHFWELI